MRTILAFQKRLASNNTRDWFAAHKEEYVQTQEVFKNFVGELEQALNTHDAIDEARTKIYRIYRDVRFSGDKTPYTKHRSVSFTRESENRRGGYYLKIQPGDQSYIAGGFWRPEPSDLLHIRRQISQEPERLKTILSAPDFIDYFGAMRGDKIKTTPKGFSKDDPSIELLKYKGFVFAHPFTDDQVRSADFILNVSTGFRKMRPFLDYMTEILTTDLNGEPLL